MKRRQDDVAQRLLQDYLDHVETWIESSPETEHMNVVVLEVMEYRRRIPRLAKRGVARVHSSRALP